MQGLTESLIHYEIPHNNCIGPTDQFYSKGIVAEIPLYDTVLQLEEYLGHGTKVRKYSWAQLPSDLGESLGNLCLPSMKPRDWGV